MVFIIGSLVKFIFLLVRDSALIVLALAYMLLVLIGNLLMALTVGLLYFTYLSVGSGAKGSLEKLLLIATGAYNPRTEAAAQRKTLASKVHAGKTRRVKAYNVPRITV